MPLPSVPSRRTARRVSPALVSPALVGLAALGAAGAAHAQPASPAPAAGRPFDPTWLGATSGSEAETYLRAAQVAGLVPLGSLSIRPLGPAELRALTAGLATDGSQPVRGRGVTRGRALAAAVLPASASVAYTAAYPWAVGQGPVWEGRGATAVARAGVAAQVGPLTVVLQPVAFVAENRAFTLTPNGFGSDPAYRFNDFVIAGQTDRPQRFGDQSYGRVDPGNSSVRLDVGPLAAGASTSMQAWGPGVANPLILGPNAGGFRHFFVGTSRPVPVGIGRLHLRSIVGRLDESRVFVGRRGRVASGLVAVFTPRGLPGLEVGATRFYHLQSPPERVSLRTLVRPYEGFFVNTERSYDPRSADSTFQNANQLASAFASWTFPRVGFRAYGEYLRNDNPVSVRDAVVEPDHSSAYLLGLQRAFGRGAGPGASLTSVRAEYVNGRATRLAYVRTQTSVYGGAPIIQGHTQRGQLLGSAAAYGGSGGQIAFDRYLRRGRFSVVLDRLTRAQERQFEAEATTAKGWDVQHALTGTRVWQRGALALTAEGTVISELNRDFRRDVWDARVRGGVGWTF